MNFSKNSKKKKKNFGASLVKNEFSWKRGLCQFLNIPIIYHHVKNQKKLISHSDKNAELIDRETIVIL